MTCAVAKGGLSWEAPVASLNYRIDKWEVEHRDGWQRGERNSTAGSRFVCIPGVVCRRKKPSLNP